MIKRFIKILPLVGKGVAFSRLLYEDGKSTIQGIDRTGSIVGEVKFDYVLVTRIADEGSRLRLLREIGEDHASILKDEQSELIAWLDEEGLGTRDLMQAKHYIFLLGEDVIDVVALSEPYFKRS